MDRDGEEHGKRGRQTWTMGVCTVRAFEPKGPAFETRQGQRVVNENTKQAAVLKLHEAAGPSAATETTEKKLDSGQIFPWPRWM
jgi:hypothetical protein